MIDILTLALTHGLMALAAFRLLMRADLDVDAAAPDTGPADGLESARPGADAKARKPWVAARQQMLGENAASRGAGESDDA